MTYETNKKIGVIWKLNSQALPCRGIALTTELIRPYFVLLQESNRTYWSLGSIRTCIRIFLIFFFHISFGSCYYYFRWLNIIYSYWCTELHTTVDYNTECVPKPITWILSNNISQLVISLKNECIWPWMTLTATNLNIRKSDMRMHSGELKEPVTQSVTHFRHLRCDGSTSATGNWAWK